MMGTPRGIDDLSDAEFLRLWSNSRSQQPEGPDPPLVLREDVLNRELPASRGLLQATTNEQGQMRSVVSQDLKPGDKLHDGLLHGMLTNDQHWELISACKISNSIRHGDLTGLLARSAEQYEIYGGFESQEETLRKHQARLREMAKLIKRLSPLLAAEPLMYQLLSDPSVKITSLHHLVEAWEHAEWRAGDLRNDLHRIQQAAAKLAKDDAVLTKARLSKAESRKSPERRFIWEPFFEFWTRWGHELGYSTDGPIMRALRVIHAGLEIEPPAGKSVQMAISEFKGKHRPAKKRRTRSSTLKRAG